MVLAIDTYYLPEEAHTVGVIFELGCSYPQDTIKSILPSDKYSSYIPGEFYKRELPPILDLLKKISLNGIEYIILDGYILLKYNDGNIKDDETLKDFQKDVSDIVEIRGFLHEQHRNNWYSGGSIINGDKVGEQEAYDRMKKEFIPDIEKKITDFVNKWNFKIRK